MSRDGRWLALASRSELRIVDRSGPVVRRIAHDPWDSFCGSSCFFDAEARLWCVRPGDQPGTNDRLTVVPPRRDAALIETVIENPVGHFSLFPCPGGHGALIDVGCGQDGSYLYLARLSDSVLTVEPYPFADRAFAGGFSPNGREFVTGAHSGDALKVHSFPDGRVVGSIDSDTLFGREVLPDEHMDAIGYQAIFLDDDHLLTDTRFGRMLLIQRRDLRVLGTVWPVGCKLRAYSKYGRGTDEPTEIVGYEVGLTSLHPAGHGRLLAVYNERALRLLDVEPLLALGNTVAR
jgi:hypothetical protein